MVERKKRVAVLGLGIENLALTDYLLQKGAHVTVCDRRTPQQLGERYTTLHNLGVDFRLGLVLPGRIGRFQCIISFTGITLIPTGVG